MESKNWELNLDNGQCKREKEELKSKNQELNDNIGQVKKDSEEVNWKNWELSSDLKECGKRVNALESDKMKNRELSLDLKEWCKRVDALELDKRSLSQDMQVLSKHHALSIHMEKVLFICLPNVKL